MATAELMLGMWSGWPSWALTKRPESDTPAEWQTRTEYSWAVASFDLANLVSAWPAGLLTGWIGRKGCLVSIATALSLSFGVLYTSAHWAVFVARSLAGVCKSVVYATVPGFLAEVSANDSRGRLNVVVASFDSIGMLVAMAAGPKLPYDVMNGLSLGVGLAFLVAVIRVPETPYYLLAKGRTDDARRSFRWYHPGGEDPAFLAMNKSVQEDMSEPGTYRELFTDDGNRVALLLVAGACFAQRAGGISSMMAYSTSTLPARGPVSPENVAAAFAAVRLAFTMTTAALIDRFGRRPLLIGSHLCLAAITAVYAAVLYADNGPSSAGWTPFACVLLFVVAYSMGAGIVPAALLGEMFPENVKSKAVSVVSVVSSLGSFLSNKMYLPVTDTAGVYVMYLVFCAINLTWAVCAYAYLFETKGLELSDIQDVLDEFNSSCCSDDRDDGGNSGRGSGANHSESHVIDALPEDDRATK